MECHARTREHWCTPLRPSTHHRKAMALAIATEHLMVTCWTLGAQHIEMLAILPLQQSENASAKRTTPTNANALEEDPPPPPFAGSRYLILLPSTSHRQLIPPGVVL